MVLKKGFLKLKNRNSVGVFFIKRKDDVENDSINQIYGDILVYYEDKVGENGVDIVGDGEVNFLESYENVVLNINGVNIFLLEKQNER